MIVLLLVICIIAILFCLTQQCPEKFFNLTEVGYHSDKLIEKPLPRLDNDFIMDDSIEGFYNTLFGRLVDTSIQLPKLTDKPENVNTQARNTVYNFINQQIKSVCNEELWILKNDMTVTRANNVYFVKFFINRYSRVNSSTMVKATLLYNCEENVFKIASMDLNQKFADRSKPQVSNELSSLEDNQIYLDFNDYKDQVLPTVNQPKPVQVTC